jgi:SAM-dependent methyltransferase
MLGNSLSPSGLASRGVLRSCRVCSGAVSEVFRARERMFGLAGDFAYVECGACGALQIKQIPGELDDYYGDAYYTNEAVKRHTIIRGSSWIRRFYSRLRLRRGALVRALSGRRYSRFEWFRRTSTSLEDSILDVGCGSGRLLCRMHRSGFRNLTGIDVRWEGETDPAPGLRFEGHSPDAHCGTYRLVMAHHSLEHMEDPVGAFAAMSRLVAPGGTLLIRVPLADSWARRHYGTDWVQLDAPRHLTLPTRRSLDLLARRNGMRIVHVEDDSGPFQIWGSEVYRKGRTLLEGGRGGRRCLSMGARLSARWRARRLSQQRLGDQACFYLRWIDSGPA